MASAESAGWAVACSAASAPCTRAQDAETKTDGIVTLMEPGQVGKYPFKPMG